MLCCVVLWTPTPIRVHGVVLCCGVLCSVVLWILTPLRVHGVVLCCVVLCSVVLCGVVLWTPTPLRVHGVVLCCVVLCLRCVVCSVCVPVYDFLDLLCRIVRGFCQFKDNIHFFPKGHHVIPL